MTWIILVVIALESGTWTFEPLPPRAINAGSSGAIHVHSPREGPSLLARGGSPENIDGDHNSAPDGAVK